MPFRIEQPNQFVAATSNAWRFGSHKNFSKHAASYFSLRHARLIFLVKKIFSSRLKIKFIFFLSLSQLISSLKPAGEGSHKAHVNKL
jgi:hypothetical protein